MLSLLEIEQVGLISGDVTLMSLRVWCDVGIKQNTFNRKQAAMMIPVDEAEGHVGRTNNWVNKTHSDFW